MIFVILCFTECKNIMKAFFELINTDGLISVIAGDIEFLYFLFMFLVLLGSYLLGSVNSAIIVSRVLFRDDVRKHGSGNAGMTNMLRTYGKKAAVLTLIGDLMKTVLSVGTAGLFFGFNYIGGMSVNYVLYVAGLLAAIGHIFPCFYLFKGGKGVLVTATMGLILTPLIFLALFVIFVIAVALWRYISLGSVTVAVLYPVALDFYFKAVLHAQPSGPILLTSMVLAALIVWCHRENLKRISNQTENKFSFGKKKNEE